MSALTRSLSLHSGDTSASIAPLFIAGETWISVPMSDETSRLDETRGVTTLVQLLYAGRRVEGHSHLTSLSGKTWFMMRSSGAWGVKEISGQGDR